MELEKCLSKGESQNKNMNCAMRSAIRRLSARWHTGNSHFSKIMQDERGGGNASLLSFMSMRSTYCRQKNLHSRCNTSIILIRNTWTKGALEVVTGIKNPAIYF